MLSMNLLHACIGHFVCDVLNNDFSCDTSYADIRRWVDSSYIDAFYNHLLVFYEGEPLGRRFLDHITLAEEEALADVVLMCLDEALGLMAGLEYRFPYTRFETSYLGRHGRAFHLETRPILTPNYRYPSL